MTKEEKIASTPITIDCFEMDDFDYETDIDVLTNHDTLGEFDYTECIPIYGCWSRLIDNLESLRQKYNETKDERYWKELIRLLPNSYKVVKL